MFGAPLSPGSLPNRNLSSSDESSIAGQPSMKFFEKAAIAAAAVVGANALLSAGGKRKFQLHSKVVLITGGSRGLGFALAQELGRRGSRLALCARDAEELEEACRRLGREQIEAVPFTADLADKQDAELLIERVIKRFGHVDVLVNNAGHIQVGPFDSFDRADYERAMQVMFWAPVNLSLAVLPHMRGRGQGHIVNITSVGGRVSVPHLLPYSCAKFAAVGFSTGLSAEAKSKGIHVLTVVPGLMRTGSYLNAEFAGQAKAEFAWFGVLGNLPGFSVAAEYAASQIRKALEAQRYMCTISLPAKILIAFDALIPEITRRMFATVSRALPQTPARNIVPGKALNPSFGKIFHGLTTLGRSSALKFNE